MKSPEQRNASGFSFLLGQLTPQRGTLVLGMLLLLREHTGGEKGRVVIRNASATVDKVMRIANFDKLFDMPAANDSVAG